MRPTGADLDILAAGAVVVVVIKIEREVLISPEGKVLFHTLSQTAVLEPVQHQKAVITGFHKIAVNQFDIDPVVLVITHYRLVEIALLL